MTGEERNEGSSAKEGLATQARSSAAHTVRSLCTELSTCAEDHQQHGGGAWGILTSPTVNSRLPWTHTRMQVQALQQQQLGNPARSAAQRRPPRALALAHGPVAAEQLNLSGVLLQGWHTHVASVAPVPRSRCRHGPAAARRALLVPRATEVRSVS